jgi:hypothetical protein
MLYNIYFSPAQEIISLNLVNDWGLLKQILSYLPLFPAYKQINRKYCYRNIGETNN